MNLLPHDDDRLRFVTAGVEFFVVFGVLLGGGVLLDLRLGTMPIWTLIGLAAGFASGLYRLLRSIKQQGEKDNSAEDPNDR
jgi:F0F1-type ATP synthase assembly protein I